MRLLIIVLSVVFLSSCVKSNLKYDKPYFDFDSLVTSQVKALSNSEWKKISSLNKKVDTILIHRDSMRTELDVFTQLDVINKPVFKNKYSVEESKDTHSNLKVRTYRFHENNSEKIKSPVPFVSFYYFNQFSDLRKITSSYSDNNVLFSSSRQLSLEFEEGSQKRIVTYNIKGIQKMMLADSVLLDIKAIRSN